MYVAGIAGALVFYTTVLSVSIWAGIKKRKKITSKSLDYLILGNRNLGLILGISTLVGTWTGGIFIHGTAETIFSKSLAWCQLPVGYSFSLLFGVVLFIKPIRNDKKFVTILDPFQQQYGPRFGSLLFIPITLLSDILWCAAIIKALSNTIAVIFEIDTNISISVGLLLIIIYILFGGIYTTGIADTLQLIILILGLGIATPYMILNPSVVSLEKNLIKNKDWLGEVPTEDLPNWIDNLLLLIFGGLSSQSYFQQMISIKSTSNAKIVSVVSMIFCLALALPSALIGLVAREIDWSLIDNYNKTSLTVNNNIAYDINTGSILPIILKYLTPQWVGFISLGGILSTVMTAATSSILASSFIFVRNIYKITIRPKANDNELIWILRIVVILISLMSGGIVFSIRSANIYYLSYLSSDLTYVILFPQLLAVIYWPSLIDTYGCLAGYLISIIMRIAGGEKKLGIWPPLINYPFFDQETQIQKFPFRTAIVISSIIIQLFVSFITKTIFCGFDGTVNNNINTNQKKRLCPKCCDFLGIYSLSTGNKKGSKKQSKSSSGAALILDDSAITLEGSLRDGCDSTDSQEELTAASVDNNYNHNHQLQQYQDSSISQKICKESNNIINLSNFKDEHHIMLRRGMSVQNTPVTRIDRNIYTKNATQTPGRTNNNNNRKLISISSQQQQQQQSCSSNNNNFNSEQILAVKNLIPSSCYLTNSGPLNHNNNNSQKIIVNNNNNTATVTPTGVAAVSTSSFFSNQIHNNNNNSTNSTVIYGKLESIKITKDVENKASGLISGDRSFLELNLNHNLNNHNNFKDNKVESSGEASGPVISSSSSSSSSSTGIVKKNVVGVKLVGMDGTTTLRRPAQSTFSPTPSIELVEILDNKKQSGSREEGVNVNVNVSVSVNSGGPVSLSPIPTTLGVEACKIHGTAIDGSGNEHCRIKRGIVRHHSFNETGDRALTTLARQPAYPSMPLRTEDCRMTVLITNKKDRNKSSGSHIIRYSSVSDENNEHISHFSTGFTGAVTEIGTIRRGLVTSPTYGIYGSTIIPDADVNVNDNNNNNNNNNDGDREDDEDDNEAISRF